MRADGAEEVSRFESAWVQMAQQWHGGLLLDLVPWSFTARGRCLSNASSISLGHALSTATARHSTQCHSVGVALHVVSRAISGLPMTETRCGVVKAG